MSAPLFDEMSHACKSAKSALGNLDLSFDGHKSLTEYEGAAAANLLTTFGHADLVSELTGCQSLQITIEKIVDDCAECPLDNWHMIASWSVLSGSGRRDMPRDWMHDGSGDALDAELVADLLEDRPTAAVLRWLRLCGARGLRWVSLCSHSGEWLQSYTAAGDEDEPEGDALVWVSPESIISESGLGVSLANGRWVDSVTGEDRDAEVSRWANRVADDEISIMDTYTRGYVYGYQVTISADMDGTIDGEYSCFGFFESSVSDEIYGVHEVLNDAVHDFVRNLARHKYERK